MRSWIRRPLGAVLVAAAIAVAATGGIVATAPNRPVVTATPTPTGCVAGPVSYTPDGPDPWGGCWPGPNTVGIPAGTNLSTYSGSCTISTAGLVLDAKIINCTTLTIAAVGVVITRSRINGYPWIDDPNPATIEASVSVSDSEINNPPVASGAGESIGKSHFSVTRSLIRGGRRSAWCEFACSVTDSYLAEQEEGVLNCTTPSCAWHEAGIRQGSGNGTTTGVQVMRHNYVACDADEVEANEPGNESDTSGCSAAFSGYGDFAPIQNNTVERNLISGPTGAGYCAYGGNSGGGKPFPNGANNSWSDNIFIKRPDRPGCGYYGTTTDFNMSLSGNVFTNNKLWNAATQTLSNVPANG